MRLRQILEGNFRKSELTLFEEFAKKNPKMVEKLGPDDAIAILSQSRNQIIFIYGFTEIESPTGPRKILVSKKHRMLGGTWSPFMLANYAKAVGLELSGMNFFEERFAHLVEGQ